MCQDPDAAKDLLQETFIKVWDKSHQYDPEKGKFFTWVYRIARNTVLNSLRSKNDLIQNKDLSVYTNKEDNTETIDHSGLKGSILKLDEHHREALRLVYFNGLTHREAHEEMGVPLGTFKSYIRQALKKLKEVYGEELLFLLIYLGLLI